VPSITGKMDAAVLKSNFSPMISTLSRQLELASSEYEFKLSELLSAFSVCSARAVFNLLCNILSMAEK